MPVDGGVNWKVAVADFCGADTPTSQGSGLSREWRVGVVGGVVGGQGVGEVALYTHPH